MEWLSADSKTAIGGGQVLRPCAVGADFCACSLRLLHSLNEQRLMIGLDSDCILVSVVNSVGTELATSSHPQRQLLGGWAGTDVQLGVLR